MKFRLIRVFFALCVSLFSLLSFFAQQRPSTNGGIFFDRPHLVTKSDSRFPKSVVLGQKLLIFFEEIDKKSESFTISLIERNEGELDWSESRSVAGPFSYSGGVPDAFSVAKSKNGVVAIAVQTSTRSLGVFSSNDGGTSFSAAEFDEQERAVVGPRIFGTNDGGFMLFASLGENGTNGNVGSFSLLFSKSDDGKSWKPLSPFLPASRVNVPFVPFLESTKDGDVVVFQGLQQAGSAFQLYITRTNDGGKSWTETKALTTDARKRNQQPFLWTAKDGKLIVCWERSESLSDRAQICTAHITDNDELLGEYEITKAGSANAHRPRFFRFLDEDRLVWFDDRSGTERAYWAKKIGEFYQEEVLPFREKNGEFVSPLVTQNDIAFSWQEVNNDGTGKIAVLETDRSAEKPKIIAKSFTEGKRATAEKAQASISFPDDPSGIVGWTWIWTDDESEEPPSTLDAVLPISENALFGAAHEDGRWFFKARVLDAAGNWSPSSTLEYHRDLTPPSPPLIREIETDKYGFVPSNDFFVEWEADESDDDIAGWTWSLTPISSIPKDLAVNKTHPLRLAENQVEKKVSDLILSSTKSGEMRKWRELSRPPRMILGTDAQAQFLNEPNGLFLLSVAGIDEVGNIGEAADVFVLLNKYAPETKILAVEQKTDDRGTVELSITGEGFLYDGTISEITVYSSQGASYSFKKSEGDFIVESDEKITGIRLPDMKAGSYTVSLRHTDRGVQGWSGNLKVSESGAVISANRYVFEPIWKIVQNDGKNKTIFDIVPVPFLLALFLAICMTMASIRSLAVSASDARLLKAEIEAALKGGEMPMEKRIELKNRGVSLKAKLFGFTTALVIGIVTIVAVSLGTRLSKTQERTLLSALQDRVNVVMESMANGVRNYLPEAEEKTNEIMLLPTQTKFFSEANWATITALPADNSSVNLDFVWSSNDPQIEEKIDATEFSQGTARLKNADERIFGKAAALNEEAGRQVREISARMEAIRAEKTGASEERNAQLNEQLSLLRNEIDSRLNELSSDAAASLPEFSTEKLDREQEKYIFYKPVLFRMSGDNDTFVRAFVLMEVSTDTVKTEIDRAIREIIVISALVALLAIILGDIGALFVASVIVKPIQKLVLHVKKIGEAKDKETLEGEEIVIKSQDEIRTLGDAVNDMTRGLVEAAKAEKEAAKIREENIRTREEAAKAQAEAAEAQARVLEEQEKALEAQKMNMDGKAVQNALIPLNSGRENKQTTASYKDKEIDLFCYYEGSDDVSGDFFDYRKLDERWYAVIKCDVSGHGIPAALLVAVIATIFREYFSEWNFKKNGTRINELAGKLNEFIGNLGLRGKFATLLIGLFDSQKDEVYLCHAGDRIVRVFDAQKKQQKTIELDSAQTGMPAAGQIEQWMVDMKGGYKVRKIPLKKGDILFLYTDGIEEAQSVFKDSHFRTRKCGETHNLDKDGKHINHMPDETYEEFGNDRIKEIVECVFNKKKYTLSRCHPQNPKEVLEFDLSKCTGSCEDMIMALAAIEKVFRMYKRPDAHGSVSKDDKGNIRIDGDGIRVDRKIDAFLSKTFSLYDFYCRDKMDMNEQNYLYYVNVNEDKQADDLTIYAIKNL